MIEKMTPYAAFLIVHLSLIFFVYPEKIFDAADRGHWQPILTGCLLEFTMLWLYLRVIASHPHSDVVDIFNFNLPKWMTKIILLPLVVYFFASITLLIRSHVEILTIILTPNIPIWALMLFLFVSLFAALSDIQSVLRASFLVAFIFVPIIGFCLISSLQNSKLQNMMPLGHAQPHFFASPSFYSGFFAFSGFLFLGMIRPYMKWEGSSSKVFLLLYAIVIIPLFLASVYLPLLIFGQETVSKYLFPVIEAMDTINLTWLMFERVTIFYVTATFSFVLMFIAILIWMTALLIHKLYIPYSRKGLAVAVALISYMVGCIIPNWNEIEELIWLDTGLRFYCMVAVPFVMWILSLVPKRRYEIP